MDGTGQQIKHAPPPTDPYYPPSAATGVPVGLAPQPQVETTWSTGLCGCCEDVSQCCVTFWCPCVTFGRISEIVDQGSSSCATSGALYALLMYLTGCGCLLSCFYRSKMRRQYMIKGSTCGDLCIHYCCECFALCQEYRELQHRGFDMALGWQGNVERRGHGGVQMAPSAPHGMRR